MARRASPIKKTTKPKTTKLGKKTVASLNLHHHGPEPSINDLPVMSFGAAYTWYNYNCDYSQAKDFLVDYLNETNRAEAAIVSKIDDRTVSGYGSTICWIARLVSNGFHLSEERSAWFEMKLKYLLSKHEEMLAEKSESRLETKERVAVDRTRERKYPVIEEFNLQFQNNTYRSPYEMFSAGEYPRDVIQDIYNYFKPYLDELNELLGPGPKDAQLLEYYANCKVSKLKKDQIYCKSILDDCIRFLDNKKAVRKPRAKKAIPVENKLKNLNYQKADLSLKLNSFNPLKIFDAKEIWTYNTKYHILTVYRTNDKFDIKGTTLLNYDEALSSSKRVGARNSNDVLAKILDCGKVALRTFMETQKGSDQEVKGRLGENTILLRYTT